MASFLPLLWAPIDVRPIDVDRTRIERHIARIGSGSESTGVAVLIDTKGLFLAHQSALPPGVSFSATLAQRPIQLQAVADDKETGFVLLAARVWDVSWGYPARVAGAPLAKGDKILVCTTAGMRRSEVSAALRVGQVRPSLRYVPLSEIRLEEGAESLNGAVAFTDVGELVGILSGVNSTSSMAGVGGRLAKQATEKLEPFATKFSDSRPTYGPGDLAVGFTYGPVLLERVVAGFLGPDRKVKHPSIGVFFKQGEPSGASLEVVMPRSPAEAAGMHPGDVIVEAADMAVSGPVDLAVILFNQKVGSQLKLKVRREGKIQEVSVKVGFQQ